MRKQMLIGFGLALAMLVSPQLDAQTKKRKKMEKELKTTVQQFYDALSTAPGDGSATQIANWMESD